MEADKLVEIDHVTDYISREAALDFHIPTFDLNTSAQDERIIGERFGEFLESIPAADVVEVVRCKDCKFSWKTDESDLSDLEYKCIFHSVFVSEEWYCADGQRRQNRI